ncbi:MAG: twin-arginine translocation protein TatA/E family subunit [Verrucomicrobiales bacterium]|nr:twin-arginine translocation protein TatA/E family subunit [Verrucomicrobiales bacterium]
MNLTFAVLGLGGGELVLILAVVLLFFGGSKLPGLAKGLGQSIKEFKKASRPEDEKQNSNSKAYVEKS